MHYILSLGAKRPHRGGLHHFTPSTMHSSSRSSQPLESVDTDGGAIRREKSTMTRLRCTNSIRQCSYMACPFPLAQDFGPGCSRLFKSAKLATTDPDPEVKAEIRYRPRKDRHCSHQFSASSVEELQPTETMQGDMLFYRICFPLRKQDIPNPILNCELIS
jgi:hypothetical protein